MYVEHVLSVVHNGQSSAEESFVQGLLIILDFQLQFPIPINNVFLCQAFKGTCDGHIIDTRKVTFPYARNVNMIFALKHSNLNVSGLQFTVFSW